MAGIHNVVMFHVKQKEYKMSEPTIQELVDTVQDLISGGHVGGAAAVEVIAEELGYVPDNPNYTADALLEWAEDTGQV